MLGKGLEGLAVWLVRQIGEVGRAYCWVGTRSYTLGTTISIFIQRLFCSVVYIWQIVRVMTSFLKHLDLFSEQSLNENAYGGT